MHGQPPDKARMIDKDQKIFVMECSGAANTMSDCYDGAKEACPAGYEVIDRMADRDGKRRITFKCN